MGGYDDLAQACAGVADDLITLGTIRGSVQVGLDREGGEAVLEELRERESLAPLPVKRSYRSVEAAIERLLDDIDAPSARTPSATVSPTPSSARTPTPTPTSDVRTSVRDVIASSAGDLEEWLRSTCTDG